MQVTEVNDSFNLDNVVPFFQPIMDLSNNAVWSYECLARLLTLDQNSYLPTEFLFLVQRQQSVAQLIQTVFSRSACYFRDINMAWNINLSLSDMTDSDTLHFLQSQLADYPNPKRISIEITAQNALSESAKFSQFSDICNALGINIVVVAERIESQETLEVVKQLGIKYAQGFYFSQPKAKAD